MPHATLELITREISQVLSHMTQSNSLVLTHETGPRSHSQLQSATLKSMTLKTYQNVLSLFIDLSNPFCQRDRFLEHLSTSESPCPCGAVVPAAAGASTELPGPTGGDHYPGSAQQARTGPRVCEVRIEQKEVTI